jgi:hypothetical protein
MNSEFLVWVLVLGIACGAVLAWFALATGEIPDPDAGAGHDEAALEAEWIAGELERRGRPVDPATIAAALELHRDLVLGRPLPAAPPAPSDRSVGPEEDGVAN